MATADNVIISVQNLCKYFKKDAIRALDGISLGKILSFVNRYITKKV